MTSDLNSSTTAPSQSTTASNRSSTSSSGLSDAAKIGIGLGVPLGVLIIALEIGFVLYRRKRYRSQQASTEPGGEVATYKSGLDGDESTKHGSNFKGAEEKTTKLREMDGNSLPFSRKELTGTPGVRRSELPERSITRRRGSA